MDLGSFTLNDHEVADESGAGRARTVISPWTRNTKRCLTSVGIWRPRRGPDCQRVYCISLIYTALSLTTVLSYKYSRTLPTFRSGPDFSSTTLSKAPTMSRDSFQTGGSMTSSSLPQNDCSLLLCQPWMDDRTCQTDVV